MSRARKTIHQQLGYRPEIADYLEETRTLFNRVAAFYFQVITARYSATASTSPGLRGWLAAGSVHAIIAGSVQGVMLRSPAMSRDR